MALRILPKFRLINLVNQSRALSSVVARNHVKVQGYSEINKQLLDVNVKNCGIRLKYNQKKGSKASSEVIIEHDPESKIYWLNVPKKLNFKNNGQLEFLDF
jgi:hypothetical protein